MTRTLPTKTTTPARTPTIIGPLANEVERLPVGVDDEAGRVDV